MINTVEEIRVMDNQDQLLSVECMLDEIERLAAENEELKIAINIAKDFAATNIGLQ